MYELCMNYVRAMAMLDLCCGISESFALRAQRRIDESDEVVLTMEGFRYVRTMETPFENKK